jgi:hypothetical protein
MSIFIGFSEGRPVSMRGPADMVTRTKTRYAPKNGALQTDKSSQEPCWSWGRLADETFLFVIPAKAGIQDGCLRADRLAAPA